MTELQAFEIIDDAILAFIEDKEISFSKEANSDWFVFEWRQLTWRLEEFECLIEIYPEFGELETIVSWTFYSAVFYDKGDQRYYDKTMVFAETSISVIAENIVDLLENGYRKNINTNLDDIPISE